MIRVSARNVEWGRERVQKGWGGGGSVGPPPVVLNLSEHLKWPILAEMIAKSENDLRKFQY